MSSPSIGSFNECEKPHKPHPARLHPAHGTFHILRHLTPAPEGQSAIGALMRVPCFECALRRSQAFKPISETELAFINEMKRDHLVLPAGTEIIAAGQEQAELYTLYAGWAIRSKTLSD